MHGTLRKGISGDCTPLAFVEPAPADGSRQFAPSVITDRVDGVTARYN